MHFITAEDTLVLYQFEYVYPERFNCRLGKDSIYYCDSLFFLSPKGEYSCSTPACEEVHCGPFYHNRRYRLYGYHITQAHVREEVNVRYFKVNRYELMEGEK